MFFDPGISYAPKLKTEQPHTGEKEKKHKGTCTIGNLDKVNMDIDKQKNLHNKAFPNENNENIKMSIIIAKTVVTLEEMRSNLEDRTVEANVEEEIEQNDTTTW